MRCPRCNTIMKKTMHFEKDRQYAYNACPKCHTESRSKRLHLEEYDKEKTGYSDNLEKHDKQDNPIVKTASKQTK